MTSHIDLRMVTLSLATLTLLVACSAAEPPDIVRERGPAVLAYFGDTARIDVPEAIRIGEVATVRFFSFGGGCIRHDSTEAEVSGLNAVVRPYRLEPTELPPSIFCPSDVTREENVTHLQFAQPGRARVRILGLSRPGDQALVIERELQVVP